MRPMPNQALLDYQNEIKRIEAFQPGPELDALVAERVLGWRWWQHAPGVLTLDSHNLPGDNPRFLMNPEWIAEVCPRGDTTWFDKHFVPAAPEAPYHGRPGLEGFPFSR